MFGFSFTLGKTGLESIRGVDRHSRIESNAIALEPDCPVRPLKLDVASTYAPTAPDAVTMGHNSHLVCITYLHIAMEYINKLIT